MLLPRRHTLNSPPLFSYSCANTLSLLLLSVMLATTREPATRHVKPPSPSHPAPPPFLPLVHYTAVLISHRFQPVSQPHHISPSLSRLSSPQLSLTFRSAPPSSFHVSLSVSHLLSQSESVNSPRRVGFLVQSTGMLE